MVDAMTIPVIMLGNSGGDNKKPKAKKETVKKAAKMAAKAKPKARVKGKGKGKRAKKSVAPRLDQVPVAMAPPPMPDSRPVPVKEPVAETKPSVAGPALAETTADIPVRPVVPKDKTVTPTTVDTRLVQGATCTWIGPLEAAPDSPDNGQPVCPHCGGHLLTSPDRATIELGLEQFELGAYESVNPPPRRHPGYRDLVHWMMEHGSKCWPTIEEAAVAYQEATGKSVDPSR